MAVVGSGTMLAPDTERLCVELGRRAIEAGFRIACGGLGGVMAAVAHGARSADGYREGDVIGIVPSYDASTANADVDVVIVTGMGIARNVVLVASADVVVAVAGGSGTLAEVAMAWQLGKPVVALTAAGGWSAQLAGTAIDERRTDAIVRADDAASAVAAALRKTET